MSDRLAKLEGRGTGGSSTTGRLTVLLHSPGDGEWERSLVGTCRPTSAPTDSDRHREEHSASDHEQGSTDRSTGDRVTPLAIIDREPGGTEKQPESGEQEDGEPGRGPMAAGGPRACSRATLPRSAEGRTVSGDDGGRDRERRAEGD